MAEIMKRKNVVGTVGLGERMVMFCGVMFILVILMLLMGTIDRTLPVVIVAPDAVQAEAYAQYLYTSDQTLPIDIVQRVAVGGELLRACALYVAGGVTYLSTDYAMLHQCGDGLAVR